MPTSAQKKQLKELEGQIRQALAVPSIYDGLVENGKAALVCTTLTKTDLSREDVETLFEAGESLWESYPPA